MVGTADSVLIREVSPIQSVLYREVPLYSSPAWLCKGGTLTVRQHFISLGYYFEHPLRFLPVVSVLVRVPLQGQLTVSAKLESQQAIDQCAMRCALFYLRLLDLRVTCVPINPQDLVVKISVVSRYFHFASRLYRHEENRHSGS